MWTDAAITGSNDAEWVAEAGTALLRLDPLLRGVEAHGLALILCARPRWRALGPQRAARKAVDEPEAVDGV